MVLATFAPYTESFKDGFYGVREYLVISLALCFTFATGSGSDIVYWQYDRKYRTRELVPPLLGLT